MQERKRNQLDITGGFDIIKLHIPYYEILFHNAKQLVQKYVIQEHKKGGRATSQTIIQEEEK